MSEALKNTSKGHLTFWNEALEAKFEGKGKPFGKEEFDKFLGDYNVHSPFGKAGQRARLIRR